MNKVCLIIGAGAGIGGTVGAKFAAHGYHAALARRSDRSEEHTTPVTWTYLVCRLLLEKKKKYNHYCPVSLRKKKNIITEMTPHTS